MRLFCASGEAVGDEPHSLRHAASARLGHDGGRRVPVWRTNASVPQPFGPLTGGRFRLQPSSNRSAPQNYLLAVKVVLSEPLRSAASTSTRMHTVTRRGRASAESPSRLTTAAVGAKLRRAHKYSHSNKIVTLCNSRVWPKCQCQDSVKSLRPSHAVVPTLRLYLRNSLSSLAALR